MSQIATVASHKKVFVQTFGCQMNERDSESVRGLMQSRGYDFTEDIDQADVVLYNTCSVRQHAEDRVFGRHGKLMSIKKQRPDTVIGIMGCMAQEHGADFFRRMPSLDLVCGPGNMHEMPELIDRVMRERVRITATDKINDPIYQLDNYSYRENDITAFVNIMSGCDHRCTYCIVPTTRGVERSRPSADIVREVQDLVQKGYKEVMLLGQNVNCYGKKLDEGVDFAALLEKVDREAAPARIRFTTSHPKDAHRRLFEVMRDAPGVCEHLHLPVQSGSSNTLKRMKREHTREWYLDRISEFKQIVPGGTLTTDIIVGFCGETDKDFMETLSLMEEVRFQSSFVFAYSERPGTPASKLKDDVPESVKAERLQMVLELQKRLTFEANASSVGREVEVLFSRFKDEGAPRSIGHTRQHQRVVCYGPDSAVGTIRKVKINQVVHETLLGEMTA